MAYSLVFAEAFLRFFAPVPLMPRYVTGAPYGVRMNIPLSQFWQTTPETRVQIRINSQGIRSDRVYSLAKPPGCYRILLLGDSQFLGFEVNLEDSFPYILQHNLDKLGYNCEVINLAVSGFGTAEMLVTLLNQGFSYDPDLVVFEWHSSDLENNVSSGLYVIDDHDRLKRSGSQYLPGIAVSDRLMEYSTYRWATENCHLYSAIRESTSSLAQRLLFNMHERPDYLHKALSPTFQIASVLQKNTSSHKDTDSIAIASYDQRLALALLKESMNETAKHGAKFCILEIPRRLNRTRFKSSFPDVTFQTRQTLGFFSPLSFFSAMAHPDRKIYLEEGHGHLSALGNSLLANFFTEELIKHGSLPSPTASTYSRSREF
jgi:hypothetical protein